MKIHVGSTNPSKVQCVSDYFKSLMPQASFDIRGVSVSSGVPAQPLSLEEILAGAENRANNAFCEVDLAVGIEGGIFVTGTSPRYFQICAIAVIDGATTGIGFSSAFELPADIIQLIQSEGCDLTRALYRLGYTSDHEVGKSAGAVGIFTRGALNRAGYMAQALQMALIPFLKKWDIKQK